MICEWWNGSDLAGVLSEVSRIDTEAWIALGEPRGYGVPETVGALCYLRHAALHHEQVIRHAFFNSGMKGGGSAYASSSAVWLSHGSRRTCRANIWMITHVCLPAVT